MTGISKILFACFCMIKGIPFVHIYETFFVFGKVLPNQFAQGLHNFLR